MLDHTTLGFVSQRETESRLPKTTSSISVKTTRMRSKEAEETNKLKHKDYQKAMEQHIYLLEEVHREVKQRFQILRSIEAVIHQRRKQQQAIKAVEETHITNKSSSSTSSSKADQEIDPNLSKSIVSSQVSETSNHCNLISQTKSESPSNCNSFSQTRHWPEIKTDVKAENDSISTSLHSNMTQSQHSNEPKEVSIISTSRFGHCPGGEGWNVLEDSNGSPVATSCDTLCNNSDITPSIKRCKFAMSNIPSTSTLLVEPPSKSDGPLPQPSELSHLSETAPCHPATLSQSHPPVSQSHPPVSQSHPPVSQSHPPVFQSHPTTFQQHPSAFQQHPSAFQQHPSAFEQHPSAFPIHPTIFQSDSPLIQSQSTLLQSSLQWHSLAANSFCNPTISSSCAVVGCPIDIETNSTNDLLQLSDHSKHTKDNCIISLSRLSRIGEIHHAASIEQDTWSATELQTTSPNLQSLTQEVPVKAE